MAINHYNRVNISLPEENDKKIQLPFVTGVVADLYGNFHPLSHKVSFQERLFIPVQCAHFNQ